VLLLFLDLPLLFILLTVCFGGWKQGETFCAAAYRFGVSFLLHFFFFFI
jgi:hypothetical protein